jgi:hypothetical protein
VKRPDDHGLDFGSRYPAHRSGALGRASAQEVRKARESEKGSEEGAGPASIANSH